MFSSYGSLISIQLRILTDQFLKYWPSGRLWKHASEMT